MAKDYWQFTGATRRENERILTRAKGCARGTKVEIQPKSIDLSLRNGVFLIGEYADVRNVKASLEAVLTRDKITATSKRVKSYWTEDSSSIRSYTLLETAMKKTSIATWRYLGKDLVGTGRVLAVAARASVGTRIRVGPFKDDLLAKVGVWLQGPDDELTKVRELMESALKKKKIE